MPSTEYATLPEFIPADATELLNQWKQAYIDIIGRPLLPMQTEAILLQVMAAREKIVRDSFNAGGRMMLLDFSTAPMLDFLVALLRVTRLPAQFASCTLEFQIITGHTGVTIPAGTRVRSGDGKATFATNSTKFVPIGIFIASIEATATTPGLIGNSYDVGAVNAILDPLAFVISASNSTATNGGADAETDEQLVARAKEAADSFSTAGSVGAYRFWAKSAHPSIVDVAVLGPSDGYTPGEVHLFPLVLGGGATPPAVLAAVLAACSDEVVRPLCDLVFSASPTAVDYDISVELITYDWAVDGEVIANVGQLLNNHAQGLKKGLALDVVLAKLEAICMQKEVYNCSILLPLADVALLGNEYANIGTITVNITGHHA